MYNEQLEQLIDAALADGVLTEKEKQILFKKAQGLGVDLDEFEMVLDARLVKMQKAEAEKAASSAPKSNKYGDVKKCPACGAIVGTLKTICSECGYEFRDIQANLSSEKLANKLERAKSDKEKAGIISTFPVPSSKEDLFEFIVSMKAQAENTNLTQNGWGENDSDEEKKRIFNDRASLKLAYLGKYSECVTKAKVLFANDDVFSQIIAEDKSFTKRIKRKIALAKNRPTIMIVIVVLSFILFFVTLGVVMEATH